MRLGHFLLFLFSSHTVCVFTRSSLYSPSCSVIMSKEEQRGSPPSLRNYWSNPRGFSDTSAQRPRREKPFQSVTTPSLWEAEIQQAPPLSPAETTGKAGGTLITFTALPDAASPTKHLYERVEQRGVS